MMKLKNFLIAAILMIGFTGVAQEDAEKACLRNRFLAGEELKINNYPGAVTYYLRAEKLCADFGAANFKRLIASLKNTIIDTKDDAIEKAYKDSLLGAYERAEKLGFVGPETYLDRAILEMNRTKPNNKQADIFFVKGMEVETGKYDETIVALYYYNLLVLTNAAPAKEKPVAKKRYITDYFTLSNIVTERGFSVKTQETLNTYLNYVVKTCDDILPELKGFMAELPQEKEAKKATVKNFIALLNQKECQGSKEFEMLLDTLIRIDPGYETLIVKSQLMVSKGRYSEAMSTYRKAKGLAPDEASKENIDYEILKMQYKQRSYKAAYNTAMSISGKNKSEALKMAAGCVAATANSCGSSTLDRKMNYIYADDLLVRAGFGRKYTGNYPSTSEKFDAGIANGQSVNLPCWGVNVTVR